MKLRKPGTTKPTEESVTIFSSIKTRVITMIATLKRSWKSATERYRTAVLNWSKKFKTPIIPAIGMMLVKVAVMTLIVILAFNLLFGCSVTAHAAEIHPTYYNSPILAGYYYPEDGRVERYYSVGQFNDTVLSAPFTLTDSTGSNDMGWEYLSYNSRNLRANDMVYVKLPYTVLWEDISSRDSYGRVLPNIEFDTDVTYPPVTGGVSDLGVLVYGVIIYATSTTPDQFFSYSFSMLNPFTSPGNREIRNVDWDDISNTVRDLYSIPSYLVPYAVVMPEFRAYPLDELGYATSGLVKFSIEQPPYSSYMINQTLSQGDLYEQYNRGYDAGSAVGYENGYRVGFEEGSNLYSGEVDLIGWLLDALDSLFEFELLRFGDASITIGGIISVSLAVPLVIWFLKLFAGG